MIVIIASGDFPLPPDSFLINEQSRSDSLLSSCVSVFVYIGFLIKGPSGYYIYSSLHDIITELCFIDYFLLFFSNTCVVITASIVCKN